MNIYTDGSCLGNPGIGGWGFIIVCADGNIYKWGNSEKQTTNNEMEMTAVIKCIEFCKLKKIENDLIIHTDSNYVKMGITKWIQSWKKNDWKNSKKEIVKNIELWKILDSLIEEYPYSIEFKHVKAHSTNIMNNKVDELANAAAKSTVTTDLID